MLSAEKKDLFKLIRRDDLATILKEKSFYQHAHDDLLLLINELTHHAVDDKYFQILNDEKIKIWKYIGLTNDLAGIVSYSSKIFIDPERNDLIDDQISHAVLRGIGQTEFLLVHLYCLLRIYLQSLYEPTELLLNDEDYSALKEILLDEIWITINAIWTYNFYFNKLLLSADRNKEALIRNFVIMLLQTLEDNFHSITLGGELCVPCGFKGHAMCLALIRLPKNELLVRIDNSGSGTESLLRLSNSDGTVNSFFPVKTSIKNVSQNLNLVDRLVSIFSATQEERSSALQKIYDETHLLGLEEIAELYPPIKFMPQKTENCVFKSFDIGMRYRVGEIKKTETLTFYAWLHFRLTEQGLILSSLNELKKSKNCRIMGHEQRKKKLLEFKHGSHSLDFLHHMPRVKAGLSKLILDSRSRFQNDLNDEFKIDNKSVSPKIVVCHGLDGNFKSMVANKYVLSSIKKYKLRAWFIGGQLENGYMNFCKFLKKPAMNLEDAKAKIKEELLERTDWLLVYEDISDLKAIESYLPQHGKGNILITSLMKPESEIFHLIKINGFLPEEAKEILKKYLRHVNESLLEKLAEKLDYIPLPIMQAAVYLKAHVNIITAKEIQEYLDDIDKSQSILQKINLFALESDEKSVGATWYMTMQHIKNQSRLALWILESCAYLFCKDIPIFILRKLIDSSPYIPDKKEGRSVGDRLRYVLSLLERFSLISIQQGKDSINILNLYKKYICWQDEVEQLTPMGIYDYRLKHVIKIVQESYPFNKKVNNGQDDYSLALLLKPHLIGLADRLHSFISIVDKDNVSLKEDLANIFTMLGDLNALVLANFEESYRYNKKAHEIRVKLYDKNLLNLIQIYNNQGIAYRGLSKEKESLNCHNYALKLQSILQAENVSNITKSDSYNGIGISQYFLGNYKAAKAAHQMALDLRKITDEEKSLTITRSYNNLGEVCVALGEIKEAEKYYQLSIDIRETLVKTSKGDHRILCIPYMGMGEILVIQGDPQRALEEYFKKVEKTLLSVYSDENARELVLCRNFMGKAYLALGNKTQAQKIHQRIIDVFKAKGITQHRDLANTHFCLGDTLLALQKIEPAYQEFEKAYQLYKKQFGEKHPLTLNCMEKKAIIKSISGDKEVAYHKLAEILKLRFLIYGKGGHPQIAFSYENLAKISQDRDITLSKYYLRMALAIYRRFHYQSKVDELNNYLSSLGEKLSSSSAPIGKYPRIFLVEATHLLEPCPENNIPLLSRL